MSFFILKASISRLLLVSGKYEIVNFYSYNKIQARPCAGCLSEYEKPLLAQSRHSKTVAA